MARAPIAALVTALVLGAGATVCAQSSPAGDPFVCYRARPIGGRGGPKFMPRTGDVVIDAFSTARPDDQHKVDLHRPTTVCSPASLEGELVGDAATHLEGYTLKLSRTVPKQPPHLESLHQVGNRFGTLTLRVLKDDRLLTPAAEAAGTGAVDALASTGVDSFKCYDVAVARAAKGVPPLPVFTPVSVMVSDDLGVRQLDVVKPRRFCAPADLDDGVPSAPTHATYLVCYQTRLARTKPRQPKYLTTAVSTHPAFGLEALDLGKGDELCVPSFKDPAAATPGPSASPTPTPGGPAGVVVALHIAPPIRYVNPGSSATFTATADLAGGGTANYTQKAIWSSSNPDVALAANPADDRSRVTAVNPGVATIAATDPVSGVTSTTSGDDAAFDVPGALLSIAITPASPVLDVGAAKSLVATGTFEGGVTRNLTQQLVYTSSDPGVATAANPDGNKSNVVAVAPGTTTISALDPVTGVASADSNGNAVVTVLGDLESITLSPLSKSKPAGQTQSYVATGHFAAGVTQNITQEVTYASSDPSVATAPNTPGNKGQILTVAPGTTTISASHPSGITTTAGGNDATLTVTEVSPLVGITLGPTAATRSVGDFQNFTAIGHYQNGSTQNLTQKVVYASSDPSVVSAPNEAGNRGRVTMMAPGTATISATDPATQLSTTDSGADATITVLGALERITLSPAQATRAANQIVTYTAIGYFGGGTTKNLTQRVDYQSSDDDIASASNQAGNKSLVTTVAPGTVTISATDPVTGVSTTTTNDSASLTVIGALQRITLGPTNQTRGVGSVQRYTATGYFAGGTTQNLTQSVIYASSDPDVAVASNPDGDRSRVDAVGPGTAIISATHPTTGVSSSDTNDDATLTVTP